MKLTNYVNSILSGWYLNRKNGILHSFSDFAYDYACHLYKTQKQPSEENINVMIDRFSFMLKDADEKKIRSDIRKYWMKYGFSPSEYFLYHIFEGNEERNETFVSAVDLLKIASILNERSQSKILSHKYRCYRYFKEFYHRECISGEDMDESFVERHPRFMIKYNNGSKGVGITLEDVRYYRSAQELVEKVRKMENVICEQLIEQDERLAQFHQGSVNTVRVRTIKNLNGKTVIWKSNFRTGRGGSFVDNAFMGGPSAMIDPETGIIISDGYSQEGISYERHPDTGLVFKGFQIPEWEELREFVLKIAERADKLRYIGWDLALTKDGWIMVEAISFAQLATPQAHGPTPLKEEFWDIVYDEKTE